ncbi:MAG: hypothetical protein M1330_00920 [Armatimonadetes bacterium]|nr:hypothetical protein [Armatimonadota bacterium]
MKRREFLKLLGWTTAGFLAYRPKNALGLEVLPLSETSNQLFQLPASVLAKTFLTPPTEARPWVYWFWLYGNITREGITADLEAMQRAGIGGVLIMEVDQGTPPGPVKFASPEWQDLFRFVCSEASRLGLQVNMNNDAGWCGSGGPWVTPELAMQKVVWTQAQVEGGTSLKLPLPQPTATDSFYRDIAVLAFPTPLDDLAGHPYRIPNIEAFAEFTVQDNLPAPAEWSSISNNQCVNRQRIIDISSNMGAEGRLNWDAPAGKWTIVRFGYTNTGVDNHPAPPSGLGLETDKLSSRATEFHFNAFIGKLIQDVGELAGNAFISTHIDSWETGSQNWTADFQSDFKRLRGYDPLPYLPVIAGFVVDTLEKSQRFLWDFRKTISNLLVENYAGYMRDLAEKHGMRLSIEGYSGVPVNELIYGGQAVEPMGELWSWSRFGAGETVMEMTSAGHVYGRPIIGMETFTADANEKWQGHPAVVKDIGDWAFCQGINRFVVHRYAMQPWVNPHYAPGMSMGPWGLHYERTETWWEKSKPWHDYIARCQHLLRQGWFVADICYLQPEGAPRNFDPPSNSMPPLSRSGYNFDGCPVDAVITRMSVKNGRLTMPDGMSYRVLALPSAQTMTPELLEKIKELVEAGATVVGEKPLKSPSLVNYPQCDDVVQKLADELWGSGKIAADKTPDQYLTEKGVPPDFTSDKNLNFTHRKTKDADIYFVVNPNEWAVESICTFRVKNRQPEIWDPLTGKIQPALAWTEVKEGTRLHLDLEWKGSRFIVFRRKPRANGGIVWASRNKKILWDLEKSNKQVAITIEHATYGVPGDPKRTRDVTTIVAKWVRDGRLEFPVTKIAETGDPAYGMVKTLQVSYLWNGNPVEAKYQDGETFTFYGPLPVVVKSALYGVLGDPQRTRDVTSIVSRLARNGQQSFPVVELVTFIGDPAPNIVKTLRVEYLWDGKPVTGKAFDGEVFQFHAPEMIMEAVPLKTTAFPKPALEIFERGRYLVRWESGAEHRYDGAELPEPYEITGSWHLAFPPGWGAPNHITLDHLISWSDHPDPGVRYFSGIATYRKSFTAPIEYFKPNHRIYLDLGRVEVMAEVKLNGKNLGIHWKPPFRLDVTHVLKPGENSLEIALTNLWINRMIGDEQLPEDSERNPDGTLKQWPHWLLEGKPSPTGRFTFTTWRLWHKNDPLAQSGLIGPVIVLTALRVDL